MEITIRRLDSESPWAWSMYPVFEERVKEFCNRHLMTETNQPELLKEMRVRWLFSPEKAGYWLVLRPDNSVGGHIVAWTAKLWEKEYVFCYQWEMDNWFERGSVELAFKDFIRWINSLGLDTMEFHTPHEAKLFTRHLKRFGIESAKIRSVIRAKIEKVT